MDKSTSEPLVNHEVLAVGGASEPYPSASAKSVLPMTHEESILSISGLSRG